MVLAELGSKITRALQQMSNSVVIDQKVLDTLINQIALALLQADVDVHLVRNLQNNIKKKVNLEEMAAGHNKRKLIQTTVVKELCGLLDSGGKPPEMKKGKSNIIMFVGLQGAGKTTTVTKYAYYYKKKGWKTALVCADTFRAGAYDQLKQNATKAKIPFYGSYTERDPVVIAEMGMKQFKEEKFDLIIVDTSGRHKQQDALFEEMKELERALTPQDVVFVMDSSIGQAARDQARAFREAVHVGSVIITKLDGHAKGGGALSAVAATGAPIIFVGTGEHIDDLEPFNTKSFVSRLLGMGDINQLLHMFEDEKIFDQPELYKKITEGTGDFTFRDMYEQFQNLLKLGPLNKVMSLIPGLSNVMGKGREEESVKRIRRFMTIMDSMNADELDGDNKVFNLQPNRVKRIAKGAGCSIRQVEEVLNTFKPFKKVAEKIKAMGPKALDPQKMVGRNAASNMRQIASMFNPQMLQKLGGMQNLQKMMKQFGGMPGMGNMGIPGMGEIDPEMQEAMARLRGGMAGSSRGGTRGGRGGRGRRGK